MKYLARLLVAFLLALAPHAPAGAQIAVPGAATQGAVVDPSTNLNLNFASGQYWWNGATTLSAAVTLTRADAQIATYQDIQGIWHSAAANVPRIANGFGFLLEGQATNRLLWSTDFSNIVWTATDLTLSDAGDEPIAGEGNATRLTATAGNATLTQGIVIAAANNTPSVLMRPSTVTGAITLSTDNCVTNTDITAQLISGRYQQVYTPYQNLANPTWCLRIVNSGDAVDIDFAQLERTFYVTTPIPTGATTATRQLDLATLNVGSYTPFVTNDELTVLINVEPGRQGFEIGTGDSEGGGWSSFTIWGPGSTPVGNFTASIDDCTPSCGAGSSGTILDVTALDPGSGIIGVGCFLSGAGIATNTIINRQETGTTGGVGTYNVTVNQLVASGAMSTLDSQQNTLNATVKPDPPFRNNVGTTVTNCITGLNYGFDPQTAQYTYKAFNREAFTNKASTQAGITSLKGDNEFSTPRGSWSDPSKFTSVMLGQRPVGANSIYGYMSQIIMLNKVWPGGQVSTWTGLPNP